MHTFTIKEIEESETEFAKLSDFLKFKVPFYQMVFRMKTKDFEKYNKEIELDNDLPLFHLMTRLVEPQNSKEEQKKSEEQIKTENHEHRGVHEQDGKINTFDDNLYAEMIKNKQKNFKLK